MRTRFYLTAAILVLALFTVAGCGSPPATPAFSPLQAAREQTPSESVPLKGKRELLYASAPRTNSVFVFAYPQGALVQEIDGLDDPTGVCVDSNGHVWITNADNGRGNGYLVEYAHGGSDPIAVLQDPHNAPQACSVDFITGDLAVANAPVGNGANIAIFSNAQGAPKYYPTPGLAQGVVGITYGAFSNIYFADAKGHTAWLPAGGRRVMKFLLTPNPRADGPIQWDGLELAVLTSVRHENQIWRYAIKGNSGERGGIVKLKGVDKANGFAIYHSGLAASSSLGVWLFDYPVGGPSTYLIKQALGVTAVAISVAK
ncbi:MAG TPA: hypothetical protein VGF86_05680 [Candidatus Tumulicola sp.]|jgi:hypothetical protein